jgi:hypothetical protein
MMKFLYHTSIYSIKPMRMTDQLNNTCYFVSLGSLLFHYVYLIDATPPPFPIET